MSQWCENCEAAAKRVAELEGALREVAGQMDGYLSVATPGIHVDSSAIRSWLTLARAALKGTPDAP